MSATAISFVLAASTYLGFQWTIRVLVYPQFAQVPDPGFADYERTHQHRVSIAVGPLFAALIVSAAALIIHPPATAPLWLCVLAAALVVALLAETALLAVPLHRRLGSGFDGGTLRDLLRVDSLRLVTATAMSILGVVLLTY